MPRYRTGAILTSWRPLYRQKSKDVSMCCGLIAASLQEITRHCPHLALTVQHYTNADTTVGDYFIPKGTQVASNFLHTSSTPYISLNL